MNSTQHSPNGRSRFGRTLRSKSSAEKAKKEVCRKAPMTKSPRQRAATTLSENHGKEQEFSPKRVGNRVGTKMKPSRDNETPITERPFFRSPSDSRLVVHVNKVFRMISPNSEQALCEEEDSELCTKRVKTYCKKVQTPNKCNDYVESFALPDEPIVPLINLKSAMQSIPRDGKIDLPLGNEGNIEKLDLDLELPLNYTDDITQTFSCESPRINNNDIYFNCSAVDGKTTETFETKASGSKRTIDDVTRVTIHNELKKDATQLNSVRQSRSPRAKSQEEQRPNIRRTRSFTKKESDDTKRKSAGLDFEDLKHRSAELTPNTRKTRRCEYNIDTSTPKTKRVSGGTLKKASEYVSEDQLKSPVAEGLPTIRRSRRSGLSKDLKAAETLPDENKSSESSSEDPLSAEGLPTIRRTRRSGINKDINTTKTQTLLNVTLNKSSEEPHKLPSSAEKRITRSTRRSNVSEPSSPAEKPKVRKTRRSDVNKPETISDETSKKASDNVSEDLFKTPNAKETPTPRISRRSDINKSTNTSKCEPLLGEALEKPSENVLECCGSAKSPITRKTITSDISKANDVSKIQTLSDETAKQSSDNVSEAVLKSPKEQPTTRTSRRSDFNKDTNTSKIDTVSDETSEKSPENLLECASPAEESIIRKARSSDIVKNNNISTPSDETLVKSTAEHMCDINKDNDVSKTEVTLEKSSEIILGFPSPAAKPNVRKNRSYDVTKDNDLSKTETTSNEILEKPFEFFFDCGLPVEIPDIRKSRRSDIIKGNDIPKPDTTSKSALETSSENFVEFPSSAEKPNIRKTRSSDLIGIKKDNYLSNSETTSDETLEESSENVSPVAKTHIRKSRCSDIIINNDNDKPKSQTISEETLEKSSEDISEDQHQSPSTSEEYPTFENSDINKTTSTPNIESELTEVHKVTIENVSDVASEVPKSPKVESVEAKPKMRRTRSSMKRGHSLLCDSDTPMTDSSFDTSQLETSLETEETSKGKKLRVDITRKEETETTEPDTSSKAEEISVQEPSLVSTDFQSTNGNLLQTDPALCLEKHVGSKAIVPALRSEEEASVISVTPAPVTVLDSSALNSPRLVVLLTPLPNLSSQEPSADVTELKVTKANKELQDTNHIKEQPDKVKELEDTKETKESGNDTEFECTSEFKDVTAVEDKKFNDSTELENTYQVAKEEVKEETEEEVRPKKKLKSLSDAQFYKKYCPHTDFGLGDLVWARFSSYPYWPGMISENPESNTYTAEKSSTTIYHVRFFGDKGRSSWVPKYKLLPFTTRDNLEKLALQLHMENQYFRKDIKSRFGDGSFARNKKWAAAVEEAELLVDKEVCDRLDDCEKEDKSTRIQKIPGRKRKRTSSGDLFRPHKMPKLESETQEETFAITLRHRKRSKPIANTPPTLMMEDTDMETELSLDCKDDILISTGFADSKALSPSRTFINPVSMFASFKPEQCDISDEPEVSVSTSKSSSKSSIQTNFPTSLEEQTALVRRNNIFRGINKEPVCSICLKPDVVFKCTGLCDQYYHRNCVQKLQHQESSKNNSLTETSVENKVEIIAVNTKTPMVNVTNSPRLEGMALADKIDFKLKQILKLDAKNRYEESADSSSDEFVVEAQKPRKMLPKHVTADSSFTEDPNDCDVDLKCLHCATNELPVCIACGGIQSKNGLDTRLRCSFQRCTSYYHTECLHVWPQTQWLVSQRTSFTCPRHVCHTCVSDDPKASVPHQKNGKMARCLRCPATYHADTRCIPAGTKILSASVVVCPRHWLLDLTKKRNKRQSTPPKTINANWCFICSNGGDLICCETCPTSVHVECLPVPFNPDDSFFCEDCQSGRLPLYDEVVWVKCGSFRWWPAIILFPNQVPQNVQNARHGDGEFVVKFFGTHDHYWMGHGRTFLFQADDTATECCYRANRVDKVFKTAVDEAIMVYNLKREFKTTSEGRKQNDHKPPPYIKIRVNKPVGKVRQFDGNLSNNINTCSCDPIAPHPCGPDSNCLNRLLLTECDPELCPAGTRCNNQRFEKREYPPLIPHKTEMRGWGLRTLAPIHKGQFVIEYVGEVIDEQEYKRRIQLMHQEKKDNYYFLTIDKDRTIDAGPKGNVARFMNHSCAPNCETQKWTVNGDTRVGIFAKYDIPADTELTFNYNLECAGEQKKMCMCGAPNCTGFIGDKTKQEEVKKKSKENVKTKKKSSRVRKSPKMVCFKCGRGGNVGLCNSKNCSKWYHLKCVGLPDWPKGIRKTCEH